MVTNVGRGVRAGALNKDASIRLFDSFANADSSDGLRDGERVQFENAKGQFIFRATPSGTDNSTSSGPGTIMTLGTFGGAIERLFEAYYDPEWWGADPTGTNDSTAAFLRAIQIANGARISVKRGTYLLDQLAVSIPCRMELDEGAVLKHRDAATGNMINATSTILAITGGAIDGNRTNQTGRFSAISANVVSGSRIEVRNVKFKSTVFGAVDVLTLGGFMLVQDCDFRDMAEHSGTFPDQTQAIRVHEGDGNNRGDIRIVGNTFHAEVASAEGRAPGGVILSPQNLCSCEVDGNTFDGIGQDIAGNHIAAIDLYEDCEDARITNNEFRKCPYIEIKIQNSGNVICANNNVRNGSLIKTLSSDVGSIWLTPVIRDQPASAHRYIVANNIIDGSGALTNGAGATSGEKVNGIYIQGTDNITGTHDGAADSADLIDGTATWTAGALVGRTVRNETDGSEGVITANTATTITVVLTGGTDNDWDTGDAYSIITSPQQVLVQGNLINNVGVGILTYSACDVTVDTNIISNCGTRVTNKPIEGFGIAVTGVDIGKRAIVSNNRVTDLDGDGIFVRAERAIISENQVTNPGKAGTTNRSGIFVDQNTNAIIANNDVIDEQATPTMLYGIRVDTPAIVRSHGNVISGWVSKKIQDLNRGLTSSDREYGSIVLADSAGVAQTFAGRERVTGFNANGLGYERVVPNIPNNQVVTLDIGRFRVKTDARMMRSAAGVVQFDIAINGAARQDSLAWTVYFDGVNPSSIASPEFYVELAEFGNVSLYAEDNADLTLMSGSLTLERIG